MRGRPTEPHGPGEHFERDGVGDHAAGQDDGGPPGGPIRNQAAGREDRDRQNDRRCRTGVGKWDRWRQDAPERADGQFDQERVERAQPAGHQSRGRERQIRRRGHAANVPETRGGS